MARLEPNYFFDEGLRFECTECGACCTGEPGALIFITADEVEALADFLERSVSDVTRDYLRPVTGGFSIREMENGDCVFLKRKRCTVHSARPNQCRTYPFWVQNLRNKEAWARAATTCPGIGQGPLVGREAILDLAGQDLARVRRLDSSRQLL